jgi:hypothetical protein
VQTTALCDENLDASSGVRTWGSARRRSSLTCARSPIGPGCQELIIRRQMPSPPPLLSALWLVGLHIALRDAMAQEGREMLIGGHLGRRSRMSSSLNMEESSTGTGCEDCNKAAACSEQQKQLARRRAIISVCRVSGAKRKGKRSIWGRSLRTRT